MENILESQLIILLREELKSRKLSSILHQLGVEEPCPLLPTLNEPIAECLGLKTDEDFERYDRLMDRHARMVPTDESAIAEEVVSMLDELREIVGRSEPVKSGYFVR